MLLYYCNSNLVLGTLLLVTSWYLGLSGVDALCPILEHSKNNAFTSAPVSRRNAIVGGGSLSFLGITTGFSNPNLVFAESTDISKFLDGPRGVKYIVTKEATDETAEKPLRAQQVYTKYSLWIGGFPEDGGKQIDSNTGFLGGNLPVIVGVGRVIKGWDLALLDMKVGEARRLIIPSELGYGPEGAGKTIPPNSTLYFEVEVVAMDKIPNLNEDQLKWLDEHPL